MKAKILSIIVFVFLFYILPLIPKIELVSTFQIVFLISTCIAIFLTQPPLTIKESKENNTRDKNSVWIIMGTTTFIQILIVFEWAYFRQNFIEFRIDTLSILGLFLLIGGTIFRIWCIRTLGKNFTTTVRTQESQTIITDGAYRYIRHPSYLGAYLAIIGSAVFMHTYFSIFFSIIAMFFAYVYRIKFEEIALIEDFGEKYKLYQKTTKKMIPLIF